MRKGRRRWLVLGRASGTAQPGAVQGASLVFHQTFNFEGVELDEGEIVRRVEFAMRRASVEARLVEAEDAL